MGLSNKSRVWLQRTIVLQRLFVVVLGFVWLLLLSGAILQFFGLGGRPSLGPAILLFIFYIFVFSWTGYTISRLYKTVGESKNFLQTDHPIYWKKASVHQKNFWKQWSILLILLVALTLFFGSFYLIFVVFNQTAPIE